MSQVPAVLCSAAAAAVWHDRRWVYGGASRYWVHQALAKLDHCLQQSYGLHMMYYNAAGSSSLEVGSTWWWQACCPP
jgi:hypothetical protein